MKPDDLEQRLTRTPRAGAPPAWRAEILRAARAARSEALAGDPDAEPAQAESRGAGGETSWWCVLEPWLRPLRLCASPWGVLAAGWMLVLGVHLAGHWCERHQPAAMAVVREPSALRPRSPAEVLLAARTYRAEIVALAERDEATLEPAPEAGGWQVPQPAARPPAGRPRTERDAGRRGAALGVARWMS